MLQNHFQRCHKLSNFDDDLFEHLKYNATGLTAFVELQRTHQEVGACSIYLESEPAA